MKQATTLPFKTEISSEIQRFFALPEKGSRTYCRDDKACILRFELPVEMPVRHRHISCFTGEEDMAEMTLLAFAIVAFIGIATLARRFCWRLRMARVSGFAAPLQVWPARCCQISS